VNVRRSILGCLALLAFEVFSLAAGPAAARRESIPFPNSMAALGDSLTLAAGTGDPEGADSWSTGTNRAVASHYLHILAANPRIKGKNFDFAIIGASDLRPQAEQAVARGVDYVTIMTGEGDACSGPSGPPVGNLDATLRVLSKGLPKAHVLVTSVRDMVRYMEVLATNKDVRGLVLCGSAPVGSRPAAFAALRKRLAATNTLLAKICSRYPQCRYDGGAVFNMPVTLADISVDDPSHPSRQGQRKIAEVTWKATFPFGR
jgi:hypothetical protein